MVKILQTGYWKSGNYLLYLILKEILIQNNLHKSYFEVVGLKKIIEYFCKEHLEFPEQSEIPILFFKGNKLKIEFHHPKLRNLEIDYDILLNTSSILWSHELHSKLNKIKNDFTHKIIIIRKHEEVINSFLHHQVRPSVISKSDDYKITNVEGLYDNMDIFENYVNRYHVYLKNIHDNIEDYLVLRFDDLTKSKKMSIIKISDYLNLPANIDQILDKTSFSKLKKNKINHARKNNPLDYKNYFKHDHYKLIGRCYEVFDTLA